MLDKIFDFIVGNSIAILIILAGAMVLHHFSMVIIKKIIRRSLRPENFKSKRDEKLREDTLISTMNAAVRALIWALAVLLLLAQIGIDIGPLVAGAGIVGVALGFGAQSMVKDFLAGFFILAENHYRVGDVVELNQAVSGTVEAVTLRETVLRDLDGMVHHIPNGEIKISTNKTMEYSGINLDIGVGYDTDIEKLEKIINEVCESMSSEEEWATKIIETPKFLRITEFGDSAIIIKITGKTEAMQQWSVAGELRKRIKIAFDKNGIEIPYPQRVVHQVPTKSKKTN